MHHVMQGIIIISQTPESHILKCEPWKSLGFEMMGDLCAFNFPASHDIHFICVYLIPGSTGS